MTFYDNNDTRYQFDIQKRIFNSRLTGSQQQQQLLASTANWPHLLLPFHLCLTIWLESHQWRWSQRYELCPVWSIEDNVSTPPFSVCSSLSTGWPQIILGSLLLNKMKLIEICSPDFYFETESLQLHFHFQVNSKSLTDEENLRRRTLAVLFWITERARDASHQ